MAALTRLVSVDSAAARVPEESAMKQKATLYLNPKILKAIKILAIEQDKTYSELAEEALAAYIENAK